MPIDHQNFRLRGIPCEYQSRADVSELVKTILSIASGTSFVVHSLATSPIEYSSKVATLSFHTLPGDLSDDSRNEWIFSLPVDENLECLTLRKYLVFDTHFSGFTPLQRAKDDDCQVDVIAISGLGGHAFGSFKERQGPFMWLRDALPLDVPRARVLIYGYDTHLIQSSSFQNLTDLGRTLQIDMKGMRRSSQSCPIIFIGHSLGGLVIKEAIVKMTEAEDEEDVSMLNSVSGFLFFGVPHLGMAIESLVPLVRDNPNRGLLESLNKNSALLQRLEKEFKSSPTAEQKGDKWILSGPPKVLVDVPSATCGSKNKHPINRTHSDMVKCKHRYDDLYTRIRTALQPLVSGQGKLVVGCANVPTAEGASADRNFLEGIPVLRSGSVFLQERLLVRADVQSFLTEAFSCSGSVRVVLHGLPGIGKSTMARSFAYNAQKTMAVLWIPGHSEAAIKQAFEQYARQICGKDQQYSEPMPLIARQLSQRFSGQCLVVFDGLDDSRINIQQYLFADLEESKILITTRNKDLASYVKAKPLPLDPMNEQIGQDLLNVYMQTDLASLAAGQAVQEEPTPQETEARRRIVKELGGLPLAISIVGAALRKESRIPSINSQAYLAWTDEVKEILLEQDPVFSDYSSSVWKAFQFAFQGILEGTGINQYAAFMAHFAASCPHASTCAEYTRLYRKFRKTANTKSAPTPGSSVIHQLRFLETGLFELALAALEAVNMVTVNRMDSGPNDVPYIEMHSLVRRWLGSTNHDKSFTYAGSKMWLLGFGMYDQLNGGRVEATRFEPLLKEVSETLTENPRMLDDSQVPASEAVFPLLLDAQIKLSTSIDFLPVGSTQRSRLRQFSRQLELEITNSYDDNLKDIDWNSEFENWAGELGEQVEYAVTSEAKKDDYTVKNFFLDTLDSHECIAIAFGSEAPYQLRYVGQTDTIEEIKADITARAESLLVEHLAHEAFRQLPAIPPNEPSAFILAWLKKWQKDVTQIIRKCLAEVFIKLQSAADTQRLAPELPSPSNSATVVENQSFGAYLQSMTSLSDPRNVFFAVLRRAVKAATKQFLESCPAVEILNEQKVTFKEICQRAIRKGFNNRPTDAFHFELLSAEAGTDTVFGMLWELAWTGRFPGDLDNLIAAETFKAISNDLKDAAKRGFSNTFENYLYDSSSFVEELAYEIFSTTAICNMFPTWISSGWIDPQSDDEDSDDEEPTYINLMHESKLKTMSAMKSIYDDHANVAYESTAIQALKSTFDWRKAMHDEVMCRLNKTQLTDRTGLGPFFAKMHFAGCDESLRLAYSVLQHGTSEDVVGNLDHLIHIENAWNSSRAR